jgi:GDP-L-fucose synthase
MDRTARIYVAGHTGLVGSALLRRLQADGHSRLQVRPHADLDLTDGVQVEAFFGREKPEYVFLAAARVGGIQANASYPADFIRANLAIELNVLHSARVHGVRRLLFFGSACAYPLDAAQPMREVDLMTGPLEATSEPYAMAKLAGLSLCAASNRQYGTRFIAVIPATVYGPHDNFDPDASHVLPALMRRMHEAAHRGTDVTSDGRRVVGDAVTVWGTGKPRREFLYVDDLADACVRLMNVDEDRLGTLLQMPAQAINIGTGSDITIADLARLIGDVVGFRGRLEFDAGRTDGAARKQLDTRKLDLLGWRPSVSLQEGIRRTYEWYRGIAG